MAGFNLHEKLHRANHHTLSSVGLPDSASDPIASPESPFCGDFHINGFWFNTKNISANGSSLFDNISIIDNNVSPSLYIETNNKPAITTNTPISSTNIIYDSSGNSNTWTNTYNEYLNYNLIWHNLYNYTSSNSAKLVKNYLYTLNLSSNSIGWTNVSEILSTYKNNWDSTVSTISSVSANWNASFANYINWNSVIVPLVISKMDDWNSNYNTVSNSSWSSIYNIISGSSAKWNSNYQTITHNQSAWDSNNQTVSQNSPNWDSLYNTLSLISGVDVPIGSIAAFAMSSIPDGWLKCNGASYSRTVYSNLFSKIGTTFTPTIATTTFNVPDLRGRFIRGWADDIPDNLSKKNVDFNRTFGSYQDDAFQDHWHYFTKFTDMDGGLKAGTHMYSNAPDGDGGFFDFIKDTKNSYYDNGFGTPRWGDETRPVNTALLYCIKYK